MITFEIPCDITKTFSRVTFDSSEGLSEDRKSCYISYLVAKVNEAALDKKAMELVLEDFLIAQQAMKEELAEMKKKHAQIDLGLEMSTSKLAEEIKKRNKAEREVEKLKAQLAFAKKNKFGSDEWVGMAATYHSVISTVKMQGKSAWEFLGKFFTNIFNGCRDYSSLSPQNTGLALCQ